jgi:hypothetical protein
VSSFVLNVTFDSADPRAQARIWSAVTGHAAVEATRPGNPIWMVGPADEGGLRLVFVPVPEPKRAKNRVHADIVARTVAKPARSRAPRPGSRRGRRPSTGRRGGSRGEGRATDGRTGSPSRIDLTTPWWAPVVSDSTTLVGLTCRHKNRQMLVEGPEVSVELVESRRRDPEVRHAARESPAQRCQSHSEREEGE